MKKKIALLLLILILIGLSAYFVFRPKENTNELTLYGNIEIRQVDLSFQVSGQIEKMLKEYFQLRSNLQKASAEVNKALALSRDAASKYERQFPLCADSTVSAQDCETLLNTKDKTKSDYEAALAQKTFSQNQLDYTKIYAPEEGTVTVRVQEPGATVAKGQTVYTISKTKPVWIRAYVNETDLGNVKYGQKAKVLTDTINPQTGSPREYQGYVGYISPVAEFTPKTVQSTDLRTSLVYRIRVYVDDIDEYLRQGMPVTIKINLVNKGENSDEHSRN